MRTARLVLGWTIRQLPQGRYNVTIKQAGERKVLVQSLIAETLTDLDRILRRYPIIHSLDDRRVVWKKCLAHGEADQERSVAQRTRR
jgi:hypothetical protein